MVASCPREYTNEAGPDQQRNDSSTGGRSQESQAPQDFRVCGRCGGRRRGPDRVQGTVDPEERSFSLSNSDATSPHNGREMEPGQNKLD